MTAKAYFSPTSFPKCSNGKQAGKQREEKERKIQAGNVLITCLPQYNYLTRIYTGVHTRTTST